MGEGEESGGPVGSILSRTGLGRAGDGKSGASEDVRGSALCRGGTAPVEEAEERGVEVSGVVGGIVLADVSMSRVAPAVAESGEVAGMWKLSVVV